MMREPEPRRHGWLVFVSLMCMILGFATPYNVLFGALAVATGVAGLSCHFRHAGWRDRNAPVD
jgi:hypothetical protein